MTDLNGQFFWYELMTSDPQAAIAFYGDVVGWTGQPFGGERTDDPYTVMSGSAGPMGGIMAIADVPRHLDREAAEIDGGWEDA